jgi:two-component system sensor histidine kinase QseC
MTLARPAWVNSLQSRLLIVMIVVFALGVGNVLVYMVDLDDDIKAHVVKEQVDTLLAAVALEPDGSNLADLPRDFSQSSWQYSLYTAGGSLVATAPVTMAALPFKHPDASPTYLNGAKAARKIADDRVLVVRRTDWIVCEELCQIFRERLTGSSILIAVLAVVSIGSIFLLARWMLLSVRRAAALAATISLEHPNRRIPLDGLPSEIVPLAKSANEALDRLADAYAMERRFTADASHELRTPLAVLNLRLQNARNQQAPDWEAISRDMEEMRHVVEQLLALARADGGEEEHPQTPPVSLARIVREAVADIMPAYDSAHRTLSIDVTEGLLVSRGTRELRQALRNLLENAIRHGKGAVTVSLKRRNSDAAVLEVGDEGEAVAPPAAERLFERFHKGVQSSAGAGLGLAIVRRLLRNLGGDARIIDGDRFAVELTVPLVAHRVP